MSIQMQDAEYVVREWVRGLDIVDESVYFGAPKNWTASALPMIVLRRLGGGMQRSETPTDDARITFDVWAATKKDAVEIAGALSLAIQSRPDAQVDSFLWVPGQQDTPRYVVDATFSLDAVTV